MRYRQGDQLTREYDACFYEVGADPRIPTYSMEELKKESTTRQINLFFQLVRKKEMNVYIYGGRDRFTATKSIV